MSYFLEGEESFDSSHFLIGHSGKCKNLHGHRWKIQYGLKADELIESGSSKGILLRIHKTHRGHFSKIICR